MVERTDSQSQSNEYPNEPIDLDHMSPDSPENDDSLPLEDLEASDALPLDDLDDLLSEEDQLLTGEDIDEDSLALEDEDIELLAKEETLEILRDPRLISEINEDPVRLYLKEIGSIGLLSSDQEFWLATRLEAARRLDYLSRQHPLVRNSADASKSPQKTRNIASETESATLIFRAIYEDMSTSWTRVLQDAHRLGYNSPDLHSLIPEAQMLRATWQSESPSYLRAYLDNGLWGSDILWKGVARNAFAVFLYLYMLPEQAIEPLLKAVDKKGEFPDRSHFHEISAGTGAVAERDRTDLGAQRGSA